MDIVSKIKKMQRNIIIFSILTFFLASPSALKGQKNKFTFTFNIGHSFGLSSSYRPDIDPWGGKSQTKLGYNWGYGFQYYFFNHLGIQLENEFQAQSTDDRDEDHLNHLLNVILLLNSPQKNRPCFYLFGGVGVRRNGMMLAYLARMGAGVKYNFSKGQFLNLRLPFTYVIGCDSNLFNPSYISINIGFEWQF
jgi:opacity protein-like surface antigen